MRYRAEVAGRQFEIEVESNRRVWVDGQPLYVHLERVSGLPLYTLSLDERSFIVFAEPEQAGTRVEIKGQVYPVALTPLLPGLGHASAGSEAEPCSVQIAAPLPGRLVALPVSVGSPVRPGEVVAVLETMKMQVQLRAPTAGSVTGHQARPGTDVAQAQPLLTLLAG